MSGEAEIARELVRKVMTAAEQDPKQDKDAMGRALLAALLAELATFRPASDIAAELQYLMDNLDEDTFVITRGC
jgi:hypothetical protein